MNKELQWLKTQELMLEHRISYRKECLEHLENDLISVRKLINKMEQPDRPLQKTNAD